MTASMLKLAKKPAPSAPAIKIEFDIEKIDWDKLVTLDFETYYDSDYTLSKLSTSDYVRDERFKAQMVGIKIGRGKTKYYTGVKLAVALKAIDWKTHSLLCHNTQFDGFILKEHYNVVPKRYYCTLSMARALHSNEIGAGLDEVSMFYGGQGKIQHVLATTLGVRDWSRELVAAVGEYCVRDVDECYRVFREMHIKMPAAEMHLIHMTVRMFCDPVLLVDIPRVKAEYERELLEREGLFIKVAEQIGDMVEMLKTKAEKALQGRERQILIGKRAVGSSNTLASLLEKLNVKPPVKVSKAWMAKPSSERTEEGKWTYAFAKDDEAFISLPERPDAWSSDLSKSSKKSAMEIAVRSALIRVLVEARLAAKSTTNITRAARFLAIGSRTLPAGYAYFRAHTGRWGGLNRMNLQNLKRGGELRKSILAGKGHVLVVCDSGQIEARVNGWLWGQDDLLDAFRDADNGTGRDAYCLMGDVIYGRTITKDDKTERFVGKVCVLGLGFSMGAERLQLTLAKGALGGPPVYFSLEECQIIVNKYRRKNHRIANGWKICNSIIEDMAFGTPGSYKCLSWDKGVLYLPNGLSLKYPDLKKRARDDGGEEWTYDGGGVRKKIYGGLLCENIVQALARVIVGEQMIMIDTKYRVVMTTHDEAVTRVRTASAKAALAFMLKCMRTPLPWCQDIPLNAEGDFDVCYSK